MKRGDSLDSHVEIDHCRSSLELKSPNQSFVSIVKPHNGVGVQGWVTGKPRNWGAAEMNHPFLAASAAHTAAFAISRIVWPYFTAIVLTLIGLVKIFQHDFPHAKGLDKALVFGPLFLGHAGSGIRHGSLHFS